LKFTGRPTDKHLMSIRLTDQTKRPVLLTAAQTPFINRGKYQEVLRQCGLDRETPWGMTYEVCRQEKLSGSLTLAEEILCHRGRLDWVEECEEGYRLHGPLAMEMRVETCADEATRDEARLTLLADFRRFGYQTALLAMDPAEYDTVNPGFNDEAIARGLMPRDLLLIKREQELPGSIGLSFPRDLFTQLAETVYINPDAGVFDWRPLFNWAGGGLRQNYSRIGCGGEVVIGDKYAFLSEQYIPDLSFLPPEQRLMLEMESRLFNMVTIGETEATLRRFGRQVFRVPYGWTDIFPRQLLAELGTSKRFLVPNDHADMNLMHLPDENAILTAEPYYLENRELIDRLLEEVKPDLFRVLPEEDGLPVNLLPLPGGGVYLDQAAVAAARILRAAGIRVETTSRLFGTFLWGSQGGIHCATNTLWL